MDFADKLRAVASEVKRAEIWEGKEPRLYQSAIERGLELIELSLNNPARQEEIYPMLVLKEKLAEFYAGRKIGISSLFAVF